MTVTPMAQTSSPLTEALWASYRANGDPVARAHLLDRHIGLVYHVAREIANRARQAEMDDLVSAGTLGLIRALDSFDHDRGLAFSTYAVRRIRGAILDDLRRRDWTPRSVRAKARRLADAVTRLEGRLMRRPEPTEIAAELGIDLETYWAWHAAVHGGVWMSFETGAGPGDQAAPGLDETLGDAHAPAPDEALLSEDVARRLRSLVAELPQQERTVLALYFYEELNLREIADVLHLTQSRISQIRTKALARLKARLGEGRDVR